MASMKLTHIKTGIWSSLVGRGTIKMAAEFLLIDRKSSYYKNNHDKFVKS